MISLSSVLQEWEKLCLFFYSNLTLFILFIQQTSLGCRNKITSAYLQIPGHFVDCLFKEKRCDFCVMKLCLLTDNTSILRLFVYPKLVLLTNKVPFLNLYICLYFNQTEWFSYSELEFPGISCYITNFFTVRARSPLPERQRRREKNVGGCNKSAIELKCRADLKERRRTLRDKEGKAGIWHRWGRSLKERGVQPSPPTGLDDTF